MPFSENAPAYSGRPSFVSQSVISCIAAHARLNFGPVDLLDGRFYPIDRLPPLDCPTRDLRERPLGPHTCPRKSVLVDFAPNEDPPRAADAVGLFITDETCLSCGVEAVGLDADPNAEGIYNRLGFTTVGRSPSRSIPGRMLPRMELRLDKAPKHDMSGQRRQ
jgi:hypothetical protein